MPVNILLVEDSRELAASLADYLLEVGYDVDFAFDGRRAIELLRENEYEVILLDVMMPRQDGLITCEKIRNELFVTKPIIFLTARDSLDDKIAGFSAGGDDYLVKPFAAEELVCRINAVLKRCSSRDIRSRQILGDLEIDHRLKQVKRSGTLLELHDIQFRLLVLLAQSAPEPVSRMHLERSLWPTGLPESDPLRTHIYRLRTSLGKPFGSELIKTVHGRGYRLAISS